MTKNKLAWKINLRQYNKMLKNIKNKKFSQNKNKIR